MNHRLNDGESHMFLFFTIVFGVIFGLFGFHLLVALCEENDCDGRLVPWVKHNEAIAKMRREREDNEEKERARLAALPFNEKPLFEKIVFCLRVFIIIGIVFIIIGILAICLGCIFG